MKTALLIFLLFTLSSRLIAQTGFANHPEFEIKKITNLGVQSGIVSTRILDLQIDLTGTGQVRLFWNTDPEAASYKIYHAANPLTPGDTGWSELAETAEPFHIVDSTVARGFFYVTSVSQDPDTFILVNGGTFNNGTSDVTLSSFYIDKFELTQTGYQALMGVNPSFFPGVSNGPVEQVSWYNAIEYCNRRSILESLTPCYGYLTYGTNPDNWPAEWNTSYISDITCSWTANGYRLPTEMEWMFAARGGNQTHNYTFSGSNDLSVVGWYWENSGDTTHTVGTKLPNELGLYDMSGNVWEWTWDVFDYYPPGAQTNPHGADSGISRVFRGGGWNWEMYLIDLSIRNHMYVDYLSIDLGFRVARNLP